MKTRKALTRLAALGLGLAVCLPCLAETPEQIEQRLEQLRQLDAEAAIRRQETLEFQSRRRKEEYARRWKRYGDEEVDVLKWKQQKDGTWVTDIKQLKSLPGPRGVPKEDRIFVRVREPITLEELSISLKIDEGRLAQLNDVDEDHSFLRGDWLVLPSQQMAAVRFGDTLAKIAHRYGLTLHELLRLNPGLETARLVVGSQVRLAQSAPGRTPMVLGLNATNSEGVSWPQLPSAATPRFDASLDSLVRDGVVSADERDRIQGMSRSLIGVSCTSLMVNRKPANNGWIKWVRPAAGSPDEQLVIDRCAAPTRLATP